ncbi:MAG: DUF5719 family protein [Candidatus Geothermincolia bacterium]
MKRIFLMALAALLVLALLPAVAWSAGETPPPFPDTAGEPQELNDAMAYCVNAGYMAVDAAGNFRPRENASRIELARGIVMQTGHGGDTVDSTGDYADIKVSHPDFKWAYLAAKNGLMDVLPGNYFKPGDPAVYERVVLAAEAKLGMGSVIANINQIVPGAPWYSGAMVVFQDLHLKYRYSEVWPGMNVPRAELAFTLWRLDYYESWRVDYLKSNFTAARCVPPQATEEQQTALDYGFERLGAPYLYAGDTEAEGGFDCSGFVYNTLHWRMGYPLQRVADDQLNDERYLYIPKTGLQPGDVIGFYDSGTTYVGHAGMYVGNGLFIHATGSNGGVSLDNMASGHYWDRCAGGRRVIGGPYPNNFDTYVLLYNPNDTQASATLSFLSRGGKAAQKTYSIGARSRHTVSVDDVLPYDEVSVSIDSDQPLIAERAMYFNYRGSLGGGHAAGAVSAPSGRWYLAEGYTGPGFETWLLLANPGPTAAEVEVTYMTEAGGVLRQTLDVSALSRVSVCLNQVQGLAPGGVSMLVETSSSAGIVAERAEYFDYKGLTGGSCSPGVTATATDWYFAEGYTGPGFDTYLLVQNPDAREASIAIDLMPQDSSTLPATHLFTIAPQSRFTVRVNDLMKNQGLSLRVRSTGGVPVVAERSVYFNYGGWTGGHNSAGVSAPANEWFFAEGYTADSFDTWLLLANPGDTAATVSVEFALENGNVVTEDVTVRPRSRYTLSVDRVPGLEAVPCAIRVLSDQPLVCERSMYFRYKGRDDGSNAPGATQPSLHWYLAEGYTGG